MIQAVAHVRRIGAYALADLGEEGTVSLAQNESAFPPSPKAIGAGREALSSMHLYPDPDWADLRSAIAAVHSVPASQILCGAGSMELINCLIRSYAGPGDHIVGTDYGYAYVATASALVQADYIKAREVDLTVSIDDILAAVRPETRIVFVCNPGNPTGTLISTSEIKRLRVRLPDDILLVVDQAYGEFADDAEDPAEVFRMVSGRDTVVLRTFSKAYGLAGARVGWGLFPESVAQEMRKLLNPNNVSIVSQAMATAAVSDQAYMRDTVRQTAQIRKSFSEGCRDLGLSLAESKTNFVLIRFETEDAAKKADQQLREDKLLMRGMGGYGLAHCLRATICEQSIMDRCLASLRRAVG